jgi:hypothetical protein
MHFTLKTKPLKRADLDDFVGCFRPGKRHLRKPTRQERGRSSHRRNISPRRKCARNRYGGFVIGSWRLPRKADRFRQRDGLTSACPG